jgi:curved DNA-binding protein CbpA
MMDYLWDFKVVESLANLEIACYKAFPDKPEMLKALKSLRTGINATFTELKEDDELEFEDTFNALDQIINEYDPETAGAELYQVAEPIDVPQVDDNPTKEVFHAGDISKRSAKEDTDEKEDLFNPFEEE